MPSDTAGPLLDLPGLTCPNGNKLQVPMVAFKTAVRLMVGTEEATPHNGFATSVIYAAITQDRSSDH